MSKKLTPQGNVESEKNIEDKKVRTPVLTQNLSGAKVDPQGYLYKEEEIDGIIGYIPVVSIEGSGGGGAVTSVNTKTGDVVLGATDVGAASTAELSAETLARQTTYTGLQNQITALPAPVNADWNATTGLAKIENKPILITQQNIDNSINAIKIGGTNLLPGTNQGVTGWSKNTASGIINFSEVLELGVRVVKATTTVVATDYHVLLFNLNRALLKNNTEYTLSMDVYCDFATTADFRLAAPSSTSLLIRFGTKPIAANTWVHVELTATSNSDLGTNQSLYMTGFNRVGSVTFANVKLETGNKATDWSPAPGDYALKNELLAYEIGVWTPTPYNTGLAFTVTKAEFVQIGKVMRVYCNLTITADGTNSNYFHIAGLPKVPTSTHKLGHVLFYDNTGFADTYSLVSATTIIGVFQRNATLPLGYNTILNNQLKMGQKIFLDIEYFV